MATAAQWDALLEDTPAARSVAPGGPPAGAPAPVVSPGTSRGITAETWDTLIPSTEELKRGGVAPREAPKPRYDPSVTTGQYLSNAARKAPGAILGIGPDIATWLADQATAQYTPAGTPTAQTPAPFGATTRMFQEMAGADPNMKPPSAMVQFGGDVIGNTLASVPFAAAAVPRGVLGVVTELLSGVGAGIGETVAREATHGGNPWADLAGNVAGSFLGFRGGNVMEKFVPLVKSTWGAMSSKEGILASALKARGIIEGSPEWNAAMKLGMERARTEVTKELSAAFAQEDMGAIQKMLDNYERINAKFPGFKASLGEITGNESALVMQQRLESQNIPALEERGARLRGNVTAIETARPIFVPPLPEAGREALTGVRQSIDTELTRLGDEERRLTGELGATTTKMEGSAVPRAEAGAEIKTASREGYAASKARADRLYSEFRESVQSGDVGNAESLLAKLRELEQRHTFDKTPEVLEMIPGVVKKTEPPKAQGVAKEEIGMAVDVPPGKPTFEMQITELDNLASAANRDINREKAKANPDRRVIAQLQQIKQEAQAAIRAGLEKSGNTNALNRYDNANRYFGEEHAPKYLEGVNLKVRLTDSLNEQRVKPEQVVSAYFKPNGTTEARKFNTQFGNNGAAKENIARGVFDLYRTEVIEKGGGVISPRLHDAFMRKYEAPLREFPWIAKRLEKNNVAAEITHRMEQVRDNRVAVAESSLARVTGEKDVDVFIEKVLGNRNFMFESMSKLDPEGRRNLGIAVLNKVWDQHPKGSKAVNEFFKSEESALEFFKAAFGEKAGVEHMENIKLLGSALVANERAPKTSPKTAITADDLKNATGTTFVQVMSALRAMGRRPGSGDWFAMVMGTQFAKAKIDAHKNAIIREQLFDPQLLSATIQQARAGGATSLADLAGRGIERGTWLKGKLWDLTKAAAGAGGPTAVARRLPIAGASAADTEDPNYIPPEARSGLQQVPR